MRTASLPHPALRLDSLRAERKRRAAIQFFTMLRAAHKI